MNGIQPDNLTGGHRWEKIGRQAYRRRDTIVWQDHRKWYRQDFPPTIFRMALRSIGLTPQGLFSKTAGPFQTLAEAKRG